MNLATKERKRNQKLLSVSKVTIDVTNLFSPYFLVSFVALCFWLPHISLGLIPINTLLHVPGTIAIIKY